MKKFIIFVTTCFVAASLTGCTTLSTLPPMLKGEYEIVKKYTVEYTSWSLWADHVNKTAYVFELENEYAIGGVYVSASTYVSYREGDYYILK